MQLKVPPFSPEDPEIWFALLEVKDIIVNPPARNHYIKIKSELIRRLSASHEEKVKQLLTCEELGDRRPSQFLRHLQDLAGPTVPEEFLRKIWSNRLPHSIQTVLASQVTQPLEQLADLADRIQEVTSPCSVATMSSSQTLPSVQSDEIAELKKMVQLLTVKLDEHTRGSCCSIVRSRQRDRKRSPSRRRNRSGSSHRKYPTCWYHTKFGAQALKRLKPCEFAKSGNSVGSR
ncbi:uncharacterized protein LOC124542635 [Vanessa cardui]|uniref:uncharacterized protein LOC124542635 n=1 Tax=Vanessa cardui TaxID=171605 RepID=UPI001F1465C2|nr:uncharacterized protein LOC124542635 [Vanessa cardui]